MNNIINIFASIWKKDNLFIQEQYKKEFIRDVEKDNFKRLSILSILVFFLEVYLYIIQEKLYNVGPLIIIFLIICGFFIPILWYIIIKIKSINIIFAVVVQYAFLAACIIFGASVALYVSSQIDIAHLYLLMVFFVAAFSLMHPLGSMILFVLTYLYFFFMLPTYIVDTNVIFVLRLNAAASNVAAWVMSNVLWRAKISVFSNEKLLYKQNSVLKEMNKKDSMTGLYNHETSLNILEGEIIRAKKLDIPISLIIADIDDFKNVNDSYGHLSGDEVIKNVSKTISNTARKMDFVGRYGGEEFIIIMPNTDLSEAIALSDRIRTGISNVKLSEDTRITLSGGIGQYNNETLDDFIKATDQKLYIAKSMGKNRFES